MTLDHMIELYTEQYQPNVYTAPALGRMQKYLQAHQDLSLQQFSSDTWHDYFYHANVALNTMKRYRTELIRFYEWIVTCGYADVQASLDALRTLSLSHTTGQTIFSGVGYFPDYYSLMDFAEQTLRRSGSEPATAPIIYAMITLVWFGVSWRKALEIRLDDFSFQQDHVQIHGFVKIRNTKAIEVLRDYYRRSSFTSLDGRILPLKESEWYFRSQACEHLTDTSIQNIFKQLNMLYDETRFSLDKIYDSAVYAKAYALITNLGYQVTVSPHRDIVPLLPRLLELSDAEIMDAKLTRYAWTNFYAWCSKFRTSGVI